MWRIVRSLLAPLGALGVMLLAIVLIGGASWVVSWGLQWVADQGLDGPPLDIAATAINRLAILTALFSLMGTAIFSMVDDFGCLIYMGLGVLVLWMMSPSSQAIFEGSPVSGGFARFAYTILVVVWCALLSEVLRDYQKKKP